MTQSFSSGSTIFGDTLNDTHLFRVFKCGSMLRSGFTGDGSGLTNVFENTSQSISSRLTNTSSIGLKVDSGSLRQSHHIRKCERWDISTNGFCSFND